MVNNKEKGRKNSTTVDMEVKRKKEKKLSGPWGGGGGRISSRGSYCSKDLGGGDRCFRVRKGNRVGGP